MAYRVALVVPRQGPAGMFGPSCRAAAHLAVEEVDAAGGVAGRPVHLVEVDAGAPPAEVARAVAGLVGRGEVDAVAGWHLSSVRQALAPAVAGRVPYVYATAYEGGEAGDGVVCTGELPGEQVVSALRFLRREFGWRRWLVVGDDYVWPRATARDAAAVLAAEGVVLHEPVWVPLGCTDDDVWTRVVAAVGRHASGPTAPDGVLMLLVGADGVRFNRAFHAAGLDAELVRFSPFMDETMLLGAGPESTRGLFASAGWFAGLTSAAALEFSAGFGRHYERLVGVGGLATPSPGTMAESTYLGLRLLADVGHRAVPGPRDVDAARSAWAWDTPHGTVRLDAGRAHHRVHLAVATGAEFEVLADVTTGEGG
ncbi:substrate-binding domain-containing protein [Kineococcus sp. LSe6-4]|uniref:Substrate-binding domain-containing protein n=1 Tax=Kineococcus halophytocola TaxID=3234027 RepID=A0ABV4GWG8_9ACTN